MLPALRNALFQAAMGGVQAWPWTSPRSPIAYHRGQAQLRGYDQIRRAGNSHSKASAPGRRTPLALNRESNETGKISQEENVLFPIYTSNSDGFLPQLEIPVALKE